MDSPEAVKVPTSTATGITIATTSSNSPQVESPFLHYASNLSPIELVKASRVSQGFLGLNSPPVVFASPRVNRLHETGFLMRRQNPLVFNADISQNDGGSEKLTHRPADLDESITQLCSRLTTDAQDSSANDNICCIEEYLADPLEGGSVNSDFVIDSNLKQSSNVLQVPAKDPKDATDSKKNTSEFHDKNYAVPEVDAPLILSKQDEMNLKEKLTHDFEQVKAQEAQNVDELQPNRCLNNESHSSVDHASKKDQCNCTGVWNARGSCGDACKYFPELPLEHTQISQAYEDYGENIEATSNEHVDNTTHDPEASQHQRGMSRRCLQFEEAPSKTTLTRNHPCNLENIVTSRTAGTAAESETLNSSLVVCSATSSSSRLFNVVQPVATGSHSRNSGISSIHVSKPSGIGLHLNSIVNAVPMSRGATASIKLSDGYLSGQGMMSASTMNCHAPEDIKKGSKLSNVFAKVSAGTEDRVLDSDVSVAVASAIPEPLRTMEPLNLRQPNEHHEMPQSKSKFIPDNADSFEELSQQSPKKKKKKLLNTSDGGGCKRCNCKKSKCLKLYCECFAAGIYCAEPCACQGCFNRPECKNMVLDTRQQIESRNPLAFVPKVIKLVSESANDWEEGSTMTPSSARHKRGCNCKKSMCLKKYCECYQANVGCSDACRCEGCKNIYGRKAVYGVTEEVVRHRASNERSEAISDNKMEIIMASKKHAEFHDMHRFTPLTPSFQFSDHGKDAPMSRLIRRTYLPSPDSDPTILKAHSKSPESPKYSDEYDMIHETAKDTSEAGLYGQAIDYSNADMAGVFSSTNDFLTDICPPPPNPPSITMASSASSKASECTNLSQSQLCCGGQCLSSAGALRWRSSPITPMAQLGGSKSPKGLDSDNGFYSILEDTPEILQDASTPSESVKVSSPNRKRVSPPYGRLHELGSSSTGALKSGRKFILKAVPSFPPLTPCMESKGISNQSSNDSQHGRKK